MGAALRLLVPNPAGALWIGLGVALVLFGDFSRSRSGRNRALLGLLALAPFLAHLLRLNEIRGSSLAAWVFTVVYAITAAYAVWAGVLALRRPGSPWRPNPDVRALRVMVGILLVLNAIVVFGRHPDDAGYYSNLGGQRWRETGTIPYGDELLKGPESPAFGAAATYGPVLYVAHIPFQIVLGRASNPPAMNPKDTPYQRPPVVATQMACFAFYLLALFSLYVVVRRVDDRRLGLAAVALYAGSPYILGLGGQTAVITGLAFISHIAPSAVMLAALAVIHRPAVAGALLAVAAGVLFVPAFVFPLWLGWMFWRRGGVGRFALGFAVMGAVLAGIVIWATHAPPGSSAISMFLESTLEHQEGVGERAYGASQFGFWGTHPRLAGFWQQPLFGETSLFKPTFLLYGALTIGAFFLARGRSVPQLAGLTAMLLAAVQLWKTHAAGSYVEWYYPFLLIALLSSGSDRGKATPTGNSPTTPGDG
ncbi:MAG: hypothetical protein ACREMQ_20845 [Longimicrobiales bacterium]